MSGIESDVASFIKHLLETVGYPGIFLAMLIEGSGVPLPSEITMPLAGFLTTASQHFRFSLVWVIAIGTAGELAGGFIGYGIGRFGGRPLLERYGKWIMISPHDIDVGSARFDKYGGLVVLIGRLLPAVRSYISIVAGISEMDLRQFFVFSLIGSLVWCSVLAILGHQLGNNWTSISASTRPYEVPITAALAIAIVAYVAFRVFRHLSSGSADGEPARDV